MIKGRVHSFSTSSEDDAEFVNELKIKSKRKGINFSWLVLRALKAYEQVEEGVAGESDRREH